MIGARILRFLVEIVSAARARLVKLVRPSRAPARSERGLSSPDASAAEIAREVEIARAADIARDASFAREVEIAREVDIAREVGARPDPLAGAPAHWLARVRAARVVRWMVGGPGHRARSAHAAFDRPAAPPAGAESARTARERSSSNPPARSRGPAPTPRRDVADRDASAAANPSSAAALSVPRRAAGDDSATSEVGATTGAPAARGRVDNATQLPPSPSAAGRDPREVREPSPQDRRREVRPSESITAVPERGAREQGLSSSFVAGEQRASDARSAPPRAEEIWPRLIGPIEHELASAAAAPHSATPVHTQPTDTDWPVVERSRFDRIDPVAHSRAATSPQIGAPFETAHRDDRSPSTPMDDRWPELADDGLEHTALAHSALAPAAADLDRSREHARERDHLARIRAEQRGSAWNA